MDLIFKILYQTFIRIKLMLKVNFVYLYTLFIMNYFYMFIIVVYFYENFKNLNMFE